jgi:hypothetical protein
MAGARDGLIGKAASVGPDRRLPKLGRPGVRLAVPTLMWSGSCFQVLQLAIPAINRILKTSRCVVLDHWR